MISYCFRIRSHVKNFTGTHSCQCTGRDISHGIGAGFPSGEFNFRQLSHDGANVAEWNKVQLDILPGRHMPYTGRKGICNVSHLPQLISGKAPKGNFNPNHLNIRLALSINAVLEPKRFKHVDRGVPGLEASHLILKRFYFFPNFLGNGDGMNGRAAGNWGAHDIPPNDG
jgi:hypothetical protein